MATVNGCSDDLHVGVVSRRLVKASDPSIQPHVLALSNLDFLGRPVRISMFCVYPKPQAGDFAAVVAAFEAGLPSLLNHFFPLAGRLSINPSSGFPEPEVHCGNQGAELVVGEAGVPLACLDYGAAGAAARAIRQPYDAELALSVQVVSFACGGFTVAWCSSHALMDGGALSLLVRAWSELARSGTLAVGSTPRHDRSLLRPRSPPSYGAALQDQFMPLHAERHKVNVLTLEENRFVERLYYIEASDVARLRGAASLDDGGGQRATRVQAVSAYLWKALAGVVGTADTHCRLRWVVDGRVRITAPELRAAMRSYAGNFMTSVVGEASVQEVLRMPLPDVAAMARAAIMAPAYDEHFRELVDWVEEHKAERYINKATLGVGSPVVGITAFASFPIDTDFGFGHAAMAMPTSTAAGVRYYSGFVQIFSRPGDDDGSLFVNTVVWPRLAAALESDERRIFKPVTADYLGLSAPGVRPSCRL
ncbi:hypothetical protein ACP70R_031381 [Stipagrostis hirtigluma subsp. patula]